MSKPSMRVFRQWEGISLRQYYTDVDYVDERQEREAAHEAMKGRLARKSKLFDGVAPWRLCPCRCGVWLLPGNETGRHLEADEVVQGLGQCAPKDTAPVDVESFMAEPVEIPLRPAASVAQVRWARDMIAQVPGKSQEQVARENHTTWEQLIHWARSSTEGLPERAGQKKPAKQGKAKASKAKAISEPKAKEA